jgi:hypothetical protein
MSIRGVIALSALLLAPCSDDVAARTTCQWSINGDLCTTEIEFERFAQEAYQVQLASQWCWAASISMIFAYHGFPVSQARIVSEVYGTPVNMPAQGGVVMAQQLNRGWTDDRGAPFTARVTGVYDAYAGVYGLTNEQIVAELDQGNPLLFANRTHAVVLTSVQYYRTPLGLNIIGGIVFDPWPGVGVRALTPAEVYPIDSGYGELTFLATAEVVGNTETISSSGGSGASDIGSLAVLCLLLILAAGRRSTFVRRRMRRVGQV